MRGKVSDTGLLLNVFYDLQSCKVTATHQFRPAMPMVIKLILLLMLPRYSRQQIRSSILNFFLNLLNRLIINIDNTDDIFGKDRR